MAATTTPSSSPSSAPTSAPASAPSSQPTLDELAQLEQAVRAFEAAAALMREENQALIENRYESRKADIAKTYEERIRVLEVDERVRRADAISRFETFVQKYPENEVYSPDAMFRLAELYFERSNDQYFQDMREVEAQQKLGKNLPQPVQHYEDTIALYQRLISRFPGYRLVDGAYYLLGYCLGEQGEEEEATKVYLRLVDRHPKSRFVPEAYTRIGEYFFDSNELDKAAYAYEQVITFRDSPFFDKALYKLAWTYYRQDKYQISVERFTELVDYADAASKRKGGKGSDLRQEALQYIAISFAEEAWGGLAKAKSYFASIGGRPWEYELYVLLGDVYFDQTKYPDAVAAYELGLERGETKADAPKVQDKIVQAYERVRDFENAARAREKLAERYVKGSEWHKANRYDQEAIAAARDIAERSLLGAAVFHHRQAQTYKESKKLELAKAEYSAAAKSYAKYLQQFPSVKNRYEISYYLADCYYYSLQFADAARAFAKVRDDDSDDKYREVSAYSSVLAWEREVQMAEARHELPPRPVLKASERQKDRPVSAEPLPAQKQAMVAACDAYESRVTRNDKSAAVAFKAAEAFYVFDQFEEARRRFVAIMTQFPGTDVARFAANLTIESYSAEKDWDAVEQFSRSALATASGAEFKNDLQKFKLGAMFKKAEELENKGKYEAAAAEYIRLVDENPKSNFADKALNNAAVSYEKVRRFESATRLYERVHREFPSSSLADYALFRVGVNSERFYDFQRAIDAYLVVVDKYGKSKHRADALYNAALALENTQQHRRAQQEYQRYARLFPERDDAPELFFRSARCAANAQDNIDAVRTYDQFVVRYGKQKGQDDRVVEAAFRSGQLQEKLRNNSAARKAYGLSVSEAGKRKAGAGFAAQAQLALAEMAFADYEAIRIEGSSKQQQAAIPKRANALTKVREEYQRVFPFKQAEWTLASLYRIGNLYETFADALFAAPPPPEVRKLGPDFVEEYRVLLEEKAVPLEDKAVDAYKRTLAEAKRMGAANEWTKRTMRSLNKLRKREFPLQKDARYAVESFTFGAPPLLDVQTLGSAGPVDTPSSAPASEPAGGK